MPLLDFLTDFATTGHIQGTGIHSTPDQWQDALGGVFLDDRAKKRFRRDYGLVELGFWRTGDTWQCGTLSVQVHRLLTHATTIGPATLREKYGPFPHAVPFDELRTRLTELGHEPQPIADNDRERFVRYHVPGSLVIVIVTAPTTTPPDDIPGDIVWSLGLSVDQENLIKPR